ncbi:hypothetical protein OQA88_9808 [Cercophora sp. LCS_1]
MASIQRPSFTNEVMAAMKSLYPIELADHSFDNVGLLQDNIDPVSIGGGSRGVPRVALLTNDLTTRVAEEAIRKKASVVVTYHPFLFRPIKSVSLEDPQQRILLLLAQHNIAVYSPHTAVDAVQGGITDWLAKMLDGHGVETHHSVLKPITTSLPQGFDGAGYGRLVKLGHAVNIGRIVKAYAAGLGDLRYVMVAYPKLHSKTVLRPGEHQVSTGTPPVSIRSVAICAGSGYSTLKDCDADLFITGEMSHHEALRLTMLGKAVLTVFHSNSERRFLRDVLQPQLERALRKAGDDGAEVLVSDEDEDPFEIWDVKDMPRFACDGKQ